MNLSHALCEQWGCADQFERVVGKDWHGSVTDFLKISAPQSKHWVSSHMSSVYMPGGSSPYSAHAMAKAIVVCRPELLPPKYCPSALFGLSHDIWLKSATPADVLAEYQRTVGVLNPDQGYYTENCDAAYYKLLPIAKLIEDFENGAL